MRYLFIFLSISISSFATAQSKVSDEKAFLNALNKLVATAKSQHWAYEDPFTIDSAFHLTGDTLSATFAYRNDSMHYRIRYAAPVAGIRWVKHDVYLILQFNSPQVVMYENINDTGWNRFDKRSYFHIGEVDLENKQQAGLTLEIQTTWSRLSKWYFNAK